MPKGFRYYSHDELSSGNALYDEWRDEKENTLQYSRGKVREGDQIYTDSEYEQKIKTSVMGYEAYYYIKGNEEWIMWDDKEYNYMILLIKKGNGYNGFNRVIYSGSRSVNGCICSCSL